MEDLEKEFSKLPDNFVVLMLVPSERFKETNMQILELLINKMKYRGGYITINKPYKSLVSSIKSQKIDNSMLFFIDCITKMPSEADNCLFIDSPMALTQIGISVDALLKQKACDFIFLDSVDTLSVYNGISNVIKFTHSLITKIREYNIKGVMVSLGEGTDQRIINEIAQFCDAVIHIK